MKEEIDFAQVPYQYRMCINRQCSDADTCLRQLTERGVPESVEYWEIISPRRVEAQQGRCPYYRSSAKITYAKGFINMLESLPYQQMLNVIPRLISSFGRRTYYRLRKGERLLTPSEQRRLLRILRDCGVTHPQDFDAYVEGYDW